MQIEARRGAGPSQATSSDNRAASTSCFCRQKRNHNDDRRTAPSSWAEEPDNYNNGDTAGAGRSRSSGLGTKGIRSATSAGDPGQHDYSGGHDAAIRIDQRINVKTSRAGDRFTGEFVNPVLANDNSVLVPKGARVGGVVDVSHRRGHFKGSSLLELRLTSLTLNGSQYPLATRDIARSKKGKGRRSAAFIGGGSGLGMLVGGVATGGVGLVVGGLVGGGAGTAVAG